jgi:hypothetical protein
LANVETENTAAWSTIGSAVRTAAR